MSYTPQIVINATQLLAKSSEIENAEYCLDKKKWKKQVEAYEILYKVVKNQKPITFPTLSIFICHPEFTGLNSEVRGLLDELGVEYRVDY